MKELNILILGETGVGKSTWINSFYNFMNYATLDEAIQSDFCSLIPSTFTICDNDFKEITVSTGNSSNEKFVVGQSATQEPVVYPFVVGDKLVRLIDTPGIGDTRGVDQDKINFDLILRTLSNLKELHGICILLKPNNARLTVVFRFCILELLTYLHKEATQNIVFCFTNSRGTFYRPGDTLPALRDVLKKYNTGIAISQHTMYCFDSEAYRFLAAVKNPGHRVKFSEADSENFCQSWDKSRSEVWRLLFHFIGVQPHEVKQTTSMNQARQLVEKLTVPLADICKNIDINKEIIEREWKDVENRDSTMADLQKAKYVKRQCVQVERLNQPQTVCTHSDCSKVVNGCIDYYTVCHQNYQLPGIPCNIKGHPNLLQCPVMKNGMCTHCRHHYLEHMHIYYKSIPYEKDEEDPLVVQALAASAKAQAAKQQTIDGKNQLLAEYRAELKTIEDASAQFACFLKRNAITPYNDALLGYMDHLIKEEERIKDAGCRSNTLERLKERRRGYTEQKNLLEREMARGDKGGVVLTPDEVSSLAKKLFSLKHFGKNIETALKVA